MIIDKYTKSVLTLIAALLLVIALKDINIVGTAKAESRYDELFYAALVDIGDAINGLSLNCN